MLFRVLWISKTSLLFSVFLKFVVVNIMSAEKGEPFHLNLRFKNNFFYYFFFLFFKQFYLQDDHLHYLQH